MKKQQNPQASAAASPSWEHKGVTITFNAATANFVAEAPGKRLVAGSLDAVRAKIDKLNVERFDAFDAYVEYWHYGKPEDDGLQVIRKVVFPSGSRRSTKFLVKVRIVALDVSEGRIRFRTTPLKRGDGHELDKVFPADQKTIDAWMAVTEAQRRKEERELQADAEIHDMKEALEKLEQLARHHKLNPRTA